MAYLLTRQRGKVVSSPQSFALFERAFRPFFISAALLSVVAGGLWAAFWLGSPAGNPLFGWHWWHGHEMVFGFAVPAVVGFLLTAAQNWTGLATVSGLRLGLLYGLWLLPRVLQWFPDQVSVALVAALDVGFLTLAAWYLGSVLVRARNWRNLVFVWVLLLLALTNGASYFWAFVGHRPLSAQALLAAVYWVLLVVVIMGGRVIPFFTAKRLGLSQRQPLAMVESLALGMVGLLALMYTLGLYPFIPAPMLAVFYGAAALAHGIRLARWHGEKTLSVPLLWSLHLAYALLVAGFVLLCLVALNLMENQLTALHFMTIGGIGLLVLAMMSRVSLGHTGRPLQVGPWIPVAYGLIALSALLRVAGPQFLQELHWVYGGSALLWAAGFALFAARFAPVLFTPRKD